MKGLIYKINEWISKHKLDTLDHIQQTVKITEELGELAKAVYKDDHESIEDAIGDITISLITLTRQLDMDYKQCIRGAYLEIKDRDIKIENGRATK